MSFSLKNIFSILSGKPSFRKGIHPPSSKNTAGLELVKFPMPERVYIPLTQHIGQPTECIVEAGAEVRCGTLIGLAKAYVCSNVYSSVSGVVEGTEYRKNAMGGNVMHIVIKNDFRYEKEFLPQLVSPDSVSLKKRLQDAGIVGMGGATFPTHVKLNPNKPVDTLILNGAECEPFITSDHRLMIERGEEIIKGAKFLKSALGVKRVVIAIEDNKPDAIQHLSSIAEDRVEIVALRAKYPQGAEKQLIYAVTKRKVPRGGLPMDVGCVVNNVSTAYAAYLAVAENTPLYERAMTVDGDGVSIKGNFWIGNGVVYRDIYDYCKGGVSEDKTFKVVSGGPMMGFAQASLDAVTTKGTSSILFLSKEQVNTNQATACINCAKCAGVCPMRLMPMHIYSYISANDPQGAKKYGAMDCIECGSCAYVCPAKLPLVQTIRYAKVAVKKKDAEIAKEQEEAKKQSALKADTMSHKTSTTPQIQRRAEVKKERNASRNIFRKSIDEKQNAMKESPAKKMKGVEINE